jgi:diguanylate cyclase (GGDEF)-like protein
MITEMLGAVAYLAMAFAVNDLFIATEDSVFRRGPGVALSVMLLGAAVQVAMLLAADAGFGMAVPALQMASAICLLAVPVSLWPAVRRIKHGQLRILNRRLTQRAERAESDAAASRKWLQLAEQSGHVGHWQLTVPDHKLTWSDEIYRIHGLWREHYTPRLETSLAAFHPVDGKRLGALLEETEDNKGRFEVACRLRRPDGEIRHVILRGAAQVGPHGWVEALNGVMVDVTEPKRFGNRLLPHAALRETPMEDNLTGLADRNQFDLSLSYEFKRAVRSRKPLGMVLLEIDQWRALTAHYGNMEADACLRTVAHAVQAVPRRTGDVVARYGAAEIAILLPLADAAGAVRVAGFVAEALRALGLPNAAHESGLLTVSIGAAAFVGMDDLYNPLELTRRATSALVEAKANGGNQVRSYHVAEFLDAATFDS